MGQIHGTVILSDGNTILIIPWYTIHYMNSKNPWLKTYGNSLFLSTLFLQTSSKRDLLMAEIFVLLKVMYISADVQACMSRRASFYSYDGLDIDCTIPN